MIRLLGLGLLAASATAERIDVAAGEDFEAVCLAVVQPGDECYLESGDYYHDGLTSTHGTEDDPITITGDPDACIRGSNTQDRVLQIAHDYYIVDGICFDGDHSGDDPANVATAIYVLGADEKSTKNGVTSSVTGFKMINLEIKNFGSECVHFRYFVTHAEVTGCTIQHCGMEAFENGGGGKVGEAIYVGTALDQVDDGKAPEVKIRTGSADNVDADICAYNWIHHNTFRTYGNECVDVKEGSTFNLVEHNVCEQQQDANSGCIGFRGSDNTARFNEIAECTGAGVRVGGDNGYGEGNNMYGNSIQNCGNGAFSVMSPNQGTVCENEISGVDAISYGSDDQDQDQFTEANATGECSSYPGDLDGISSTPVADSDDGGDDNDDPLQDEDNLEAGVNFAVDVDSEPEIDVIETNESAGSSGLGDCASVAAVGKTSVQHPDYADESTTTDNLFDGDVDSYYSVHRESTYIILELENEVEVNGVAIGFFMKAAEEERIQTFDVAVRSADDEDDWTTVISRKESSGSMDIQTFPFSSRTALYVRIETHGNDFNNWSAFTELEVCVDAAEESNALFGGLEALDNELAALAGTEVCDAPTKLSPVSVHASGEDDVRVVFDGNFDTRWSTTNTQNESDMSNDKVTFTFGGDMRVSNVQISFYDGDLAHQYFAIYTQRASDHSWNQVLSKTQAAQHVGLQTFTLNMDGVHKLYIVGNGNDVGAFSKFSEIEVYGC